MDEELKEKANRLFYFMGKECARSSWTEFREECEVTDEEWHEIKEALATIGITSTYI